MISLYEFLVKDKFNKHKDLLYYANRLFELELIAKIDESKNPVYSILGQSGDIYIKVDKISYVSGSHKYTYTDKECESVINNAKTNVKLFFRVNEVYKDTVTKLINNKLSNKAKIYNEGEVFITIKTLQEVYDILDMIVKLI